MHNIWRTIHNISVKGSYLDTQRVSRGVNTAKIQHFCEPELFPVASTPGSLICRWKKNYSITYNTRHLPIGVGKLVILLNLWFTIKIELLQPWDLSRSIRLEKLHRFATIIMKKYLPGVELWQFYWECWKSCII